MIIILLYCFKMNILFKILFWGENYESLKFIKFKSFFLVKDKRI